MQSHSWTHGGWRVPSLSDLRDLGAVGGIVVVCLLQVKTAASVADAVRLLAAEVAELRGVIKGGDK